MSTVVLTTVEVYHGCCVRGGYRRRSCRASDSTNVIEDKRSLSYRVALEVVLLEWGTVRDHLRRMLTERAVPNAGIPGALRSCNTYFRGCRIQWVCHKAAFPPSCCSHVLPHTQTFTHILSTLLMDGSYASKFLVPPQRPPLSSPHSGIRPFFMVT